MAHLSEVKSRFNLGFIFEAGFCAGVLKQLANATSNSSDEPLITNQDFLTMYLDSELFNISLSKMLSHKLFKHYSQKIIRNFFNNGYYLGCQEMNNYLATLHNHKHTNIKIKMLILIPPMSNEYEIFQAIRSNHDGFFPKLPKFSGYGKGEFRKTDFLLELESIQPNAVGTPTHRKSIVCCDLGAFISTDHYDYLNMSAITNKDDRMTSLNNILNRAAKRSKASSILDTLSIHDFGDIPSSVFNEDFLLAAINDNNENKPIAKFAQANSYALSYIYEMYNYGPDDDPKKFPIDYYSVWGISNQGQFAVNGANILGIKQNMGLFMDIKRAYVKSHEKNRMALYKSATKSKVTMLEAELQSGPIVIDCVSTSEIHASNSSQSHGALIDQALNSDKNNIALLGAPGIGKTTAIVNHITQINRSAMLYTSPRIIINEDIINKFIKSYGGNLTKLSKTVFLTANRETVDSGFIRAYTFSDDLDKKIISATAGSGIGHIDIAINGAGEIKSTTMTVKAIGNISDDEKNIAYTSDSISVQTAIADKIDALSAIDGLDNIVIGVATQAFRSTDDDALISAIKRFSSIKKNDKILLVADEITGSENGLIVSNIFSRESILSDTVRTQALYLDASLLNKISFEDYIQSGGSIGKILMTMDAMNSDVKEDSLTIGDDHNGSTIECNCYPIATNRNLIMENFYYPILSKNSVVDNYVSAITSWLNEDKIINPYNDSPRRALVYIQDKIKISEIINKLVEIVGNDTPNLIAEISANKNEKGIAASELSGNKIIIITSTASRGIDLPYVSDYFIDIPKFDISEQTMEICQVVFRGRGDSDFDKTTDKKINLFVGYDVGEYRDAHFRLLLTRNSILTRIGGRIVGRDGQVKNIRHKFIPIGSKTLKSNSAKLLMFDTLEKMHTLNKELYRFGIPPLEVSLREIGVEKITTQYNLPSIPEIKNYFDNQIFLEDDLRSFSRKNDIYTYVDPQGNSHKKITTIADRCCDPAFYVKGPLIMRRVSSSNNIRMECTLKRSGPKSLGSFLGKLSYIEKDLVMRGKIGARAIQIISELKLALKSTGEIDFKLSEANNGRDWYMVGLLFDDFLTDKDFETGRYRELNLDSPFTQILDIFSSSINAEATIPPTGDKDNYFNLLSKPFLYINSSSASDSIFEQYSMYSTFSSKSFNLLKIIFS